MNSTKKRQRIWMPKLRAEKFAHKATKRAKTRQAKLKKVLNEY